MKYKKLVSVISIFICVIMLASCGKPSTEVNSKQTQLYVITNDGGFSDNWLHLISESFENKYANVSFEDGKQGVQVIIEKTPDANANQMMNSFSKSIANVCFAENINFNTGAKSGMFEDITDVVEGTFNTTYKDINGEDVTIGEDKRPVDKLYDSQKEALKVIDNKYYTLPFACSWGGFTYNIDIFEEKKLYFADDKENAIYVDNTISSYTGEKYTGRGFIPSINTKKSVGPDGIYNTHDDGLPSSYEELFYLFDYMVGKAVDPIVFTGGPGRYANYLISSLYCSLEGATNMRNNFTYNSGDNKVKIVTGFDSNDEPIIEETFITEENGYLMSQTAARYYVYDLANKIFSNNDYFSHYTGSSFTDVQSYYINSSLRGGEKPIALLIDGNYWMNEAREKIIKAEENYPEKKIGSKLKSMPLPRQLTGTVDEGNGRPNSLTNSVSIHTVINSNITSEAIKNLSKLFVRYVYTDDMMKIFTKSSNIPLMLKYDLSNEEYESMTSYGQDLWDNYKELMDNDTFVYPHSNNPIYLKQEDYYQVSNVSRFWSSSRYGLPYTAFKIDNISSKDYFSDMKITKEKWDTEFNTKR